MRIISSPVAVAAVLGLASLTAQAAPAGTYIDLRLLGTQDGGGFSESDGAGGSTEASVDDGLGWGLRGAWEFAPRWHIYGEWGVSNASLDVELRDGSGAVTAAGDTDFDLTRMAFGVGYTWDFGNRWDAYARLTYDYVEYGDFDRFDLPGVGTVEIGDEDDSGVGATFGARFGGNGWDFEAWGRYTSVGELVQDGEGVEFDNDFGGGVRATYYLGDAWSVGADYELADIDTWSAFVRYRF